jgi:hypothetical protein
MLRGGASRLNSKLTQNKDFPTVSRCSFTASNRLQMQNPKSISELLKGGKRLSQLKSKSVARATVLERVRMALPPRLAQSVVSAGLEGDCLTLGVSGSVWASRIRYLPAITRQQLSRDLAVEIAHLKVRVVPPLNQT